MRAKEWIFFKFLGDSILLLFFLMFRPSKMSHVAFINHFGVAQHFVGRIKRPFQFFIFSTIYILVMLEQLTLVFTTFSILFFDECFDFFIKGIIFSLRLCLFLYSHFFCFLLLMRR